MCSVIPESGTTYATYYSDGQLNRYPSEGEELDRDVIVRWLENENGDHIEFI